MAENNERRIVLFPGSIRNLGDLTGEEYESMKLPNGDLITVEGTGRNIKDTRSNLRSNAKKIGADALVHVRYPMEISYGTEYSGDAMGSGAVNCVFSDFRASGYAIKRKSGSQ